MASKPDYGQNAAALMGQKRGGYFFQEVFRSLNLNIGGPTYFSPQIPVSNPIIAAILRVNIALTVGTGATPVTDGVNAIVKALTFRSDKNEFFLKNVPGRGLYLLNWIENQTPFPYDSIAAANGTYSALFLIPFADFNTRHPYDTIVDPQGRGYKSMELDVTLGTVADLLGTVGTASITASCDLDFIITGETVLEPGLKPRYVREIGGIAPVNLANQLYAALERSPDLAYKGILVNVSNGATIGVPFTGSNANSALTDISLVTNVTYPFKSIPYALYNYMMGGRVAGLWPTGTVYLDVLGYTQKAQDGSYQGALYSAKYGKLEIDVTPNTLSTSQLSLVYSGLRDLKP